MSRKTVNDIINKKKDDDKIIMLTAYDYPMAKIIDEIGVDMVLVGDSLANVVLGLSSTKEIGMTEMIYHAKAVNRAVEQALLVGDMPYSGYQENPAKAVENAKRFMNEAGCQAVKLEWFDRCISIAEKIVKAGIPVMGHVGLTPQTAEGMKVQGKDAQSAKEIIEHALGLEKAGCFSIVLECIPDKIAAIITQELKIPTIGIGAGAACDGQVLVLHDLLGLFDRYTPKFVKRYADLKSSIGKAVTAFKEEVTKGVFPDAQHSFSMSEEEFEKIQYGKRRTKR